MKFIKSIFFYIVFLTCSFEITGQQTLSWVKVQKNLLINESGEKILFKGLNASDPDKLEKENRWNKAYFEAMKSWNANLVRLPIHPRAWRERGSENYLKLLDQGIQWAKELGMYVILDWHSIGNLHSEIFFMPMYDTSKKETFQFWRTMAQKYGNEPTVAFFELYNEPTIDNHKLGMCSWDQWSLLMEETILMIRANGAKNIPLVAGFNWAYDLKEVKFKPIKAENIAYVSHPYPQKRPKPWAQKWDEDFGFVAENYPVVLTEIGFCFPEDKGAHIPVISDESYVDEIIQYCKGKDISYCVWVFDPHWSPMLIKDWSYTPTRAGEFWKKGMQRN
jgi:endoglucanase